MPNDFMCSYCLRRRSETGALVAGPLAAICRDCAEKAMAAFDAADPSKDTVAEPTPWGRLGDDELLERLPQIAEAKEQVEEHLSAWVSVARERGISWARVGKSLGMTRQSAWERFG